MKYPNSPLIISAKKILLTDFLEREHQSALRFSNGGGEERKQII